VCCFGAEERNKKRLTDEKQQGYSGVVPFWREGPKQYFMKSIRQKIKMKSQKTGIKKRNLGVADKMKTGN